MPTRPDGQCLHGEPTMAAGSPDVIQLNKATKILKENADAKRKFKASSLKLDGLRLRGLQLREHRAAEVTMWLHAWPHSQGMKDGKEAPIYSEESVQVRTGCRGRGQRGPCRSRNEHFNPTEMVYTLGSTPWMRSLWTRSSRRTKPWCSRTPKASPSRVRSTRTPDKRPTRG